LLLYILVVCLIKPEMGPPLPREECNVPWQTIFWEVAVSSVPIGILTVVVWIIIVGWTTATEAAALGALMAFLIAAMLWHFAPCSY
jgi:TRAP-type mannitol/chloroaromatic compound transport system permease large subunit